MTLFLTRLVSSLIVLWLSNPVAAALPDWSLEIESLRLGETRLTGIRLSSGTGSETGDSVDIRAASARPGSQAPTLGPVALRCPGDLFAVVDSYCRGGSWKLVLSGDWPPLEGKLTEARLDKGEASVEIGGTLADVVWNARLTAADPSFTLALEVPRQPVSSLGFLQPKLAPLAWLSAGQWSGSVEISGGSETALQAHGSVEVSGVDFDSPDGLYAGLGVGASLSARLEDPVNLVVALEGRLATGELLLQDFYRDFSGLPLELAARAHIQGDVAEIQRLTLSDGDALYIAGQARLPLGEDAAQDAPQLLLRELRLQFPEAYERYFESLASVWTLDGLDMVGTVTWTGDWAPGTVRSGVLRFDGLTVTDEKRGRFALRSLEGTLETGSTSRLNWDGASFEKLDLGAGTASIALGQESVGLLEPLRIGLFGGALTLEAFSANFPRGGEPDFELEAEITDVEMRQMAQALGWPEFAGTLSGSIPGINWTEGVIGIEGALEFEVFGGEILLTDLSIERPFGVLPSLAANITADALDLEQLTQTFEFGRIAGRIDGYVRDLRMLDWQPVHFDAWFGTPADGGRQDISRQAVNHLTTIGGGSPTALLTGPVLRLFNNFSYRRLGLGCRLRDNVCHIRGIEDQGDAVLLLEGAGIPKISILAYNRAVDWPQLVAELMAVSGGEEVQIGK